MQHHQTFCRFNLMWASIPERHRRPDRRTDGDGRLSAALYLFA